MRYLSLYPSLYLFKLENNCKFVQVKGVRADNIMIKCQVEKGVFLLALIHLISFILEARFWYFSVRVTKKTQVLVARKGEITNVICHFYSGAIIW